MNHSHIYLIDNTDNHGKLLSAVTGFCVLFMMEVGANFIFNKPGTVIEARQWAEVSYWLLVTNILMIVITFGVGATYGLDKLFRACFPEGVIDTKHRLRNCKSIGIALFGSLSLITLMAFIVFSYKFMLLAWSVVANDISTLGN